MKASRLKDYTDVVVATAYVLSFAMIVSEVAAVVMNVAPRVHEVTASIAMFPAQLAAFIINAGPGGPIIFACIMLGMAAVFAGTANDRCRRPQPDIKSVAATTFMATMWTLFGVIAFARAVFMS